MPIDSFAPRANTTQQTNYIRRVCAFNSSLIGTGVQIGTLPLKCMIVAVHVVVETAFNAGTTNVLTVGTTLANANELVASGDVTGGTAGYTNVTRGRGTALTQTPTGPISINGQNIDTTEGGVGVFAKFAQTGTAATAGSASVVIEYVPNNDS